MPMILCSQMEDQGRARTGREPEGPRPWWVEKEQVHGPMCPSAGSLGFSRQEYCSGLQCPPPGHLPIPGTEPMSPASPALDGRLFTTEPPGKPLFAYCYLIN